MQNDKQTKAKSTGTQTISKNSNRLCDLEKNEVTKEL